MDDSKRPLFTFGIIADIQYADIDDGYDYSKTRRRYYRSSLELLRKANQCWAGDRVKPSFILQLGDIIDGFNKNHGASERALETVVKEFDTLSVDVHHVWGNHEFYNFRRNTLFSSSLNSAVRSAETGSDLVDRDIYAYHFSPAHGYRFVVLDAYDMSIIGRDEGSDKYNQSLKLLKNNNSNSDLNQPPVAVLSELTKQRFVKFSGGFSEEQLTWLNEVLQVSDQNQEKVFILSHLPVHPHAAAPICLAWNYESVLSVLHSHKSVVCFMAGHEHDGCYYLDESGIHHLTLEGVIETPPYSNAFGTIYVYEDQMFLKGEGRMSDRILKYLNIWMKTSNNEASLDLKESNT